jgi:hypothetical protein
MPSALKRYQATLTTASGVNHQRKIGTRGTMLFVREILPAGNPLTVRLRQVGVGSKDGETIVMPMRQNDKIITPVEFDRIELENDAGVDISADIVFGDGDYVRPLPDLVNVAVSQAGANTVHSPADVATNDAAEAVLFDPDDYAGETIVRVLLTAHIDNDQAVRVGKTGEVAADHGTPLQAGETLSWDCSEAAYGIEEVAGNTKICVSVFTKV